MQESNSLKEHNHFCHYHRPQTTQYASIISNLSRCLVIIPKWAGLAPWCCGNECFLVWLGGHVLEERPLSAPRSSLALWMNSAQHGPICLHICIILHRSPKHVSLLHFSRMKGLVDGRVNKRSGNWGHLLLYLVFFWAVGFCWLCYYSSNWLWLCWLAVLSSENIPVAEGVILCNVFEQLLKKEGPPEGAGAAARAAYGDNRTDYAERCTTLARVIYSTVLMGEEEHGGGGWHDNLQQAGDLVAMATNKDVCIRGKSQQSAAEGTHAARPTVMENRRGQRWEKVGWKGGMPFPYHSASPRNLFSTAGLSHTVGGGVPD